MDFIDFLVKYLLITLFCLWSVTTIRADLGTPRSEGIIIPSIVSPAGHVRSAIALFYFNLAFYATDLQCKVTLAERGIQQQNSASHIHGRLPTSRLTLLYLLFTLDVAKLSSEWQSSWRFGGVTHDEIPPAKCWGSPPHESEKRCPIWRASVVMIVVMLNEQRAGKG